MIINVLPRDHDDDVLNHYSLHYSASRISDPMFASSPPIPPRSRSRSPTMQTHHIDDTADSTTLIEASSMTTGGSPLKNEIRPDSSCSNKAEDGVPRPIYQIHELKPPVQPKIKIAVFAVQKDGRFLLGRAKDVEGKSKLCICHE
jgi:hypothetical protein